MRFWSKGLGKRSLGMNCGKEAVQVESATMILAGKVRPPLGWAYTITMDETDWLDFIELTFHPTIVRYLTRRGRLGLALRAGWNLLLLVVVCAARLPAVWIRRAAGTQTGESSAETERTADAASAGAAQSRHKA
jgi:hypothetical protein